MADGKSLVPKTVLIFRGDVGVVLVPLLGLGTDQDIIAISVREAEQHKIGMDKLSLNDLVVSLPNERNSNDTLMPAYLISEKWSGLYTYVPEPTKNC